MLDALGAVTLEFAWMRLECRLRSRRNDATRFLGSGRTPAVTASLFVPSEGSGIRTPGARCYRLAVRVFTADWTCGDETRTTSG